MCLVKCRSEGCVIEKGELRKEEEKSDWGEERWHR